MDTASTTARGRLRLRPSLTTMVPMVWDMLILTFSMVAMLDIMAMLDTPTPPTDTASTTARGRLRPRLSLTSMVPMVLVMDIILAMLDTPTPTATATTARGMPRPSLSPTTMAATDMPVPTMVATAAMAVDTT